jgi:signal peptidase I
MEVNMKNLSSSLLRPKTFVLLSVLLYLFIACAIFNYDNAEAAPKKIECGVISGKVMFMDKSAPDWSERQGTFEVKTGGRVKLDDSGSAVLNYSDGTMAALRGGTEIEIKADGIRLNEGGVWIKLIKTKSGFKVDTPSVTIGARGTIFSVIKKQEKVLVKLVEGVVDIINRESGKTLVMKAGDTVIVKAKEIIEVNKIDKDKINAVLKQNSFSEIDFDLNAVPAIFKFDLNTGSKDKAPVLAPGPVGVPGSAVPASSEVNVINGADSDSVKLENEAAAPQNAKTLKDLLGR